jgi:hypothetical protein
VVVVDHAAAHPPALHCGEPREGWLVVVGWSGGRWQRDWCGAATVLHSESACRVRNPCTASEIDAGFLTWDLARSAGWGMIAVHVCPSAVLDHGPGVRLAGPAGPQPGVQGLRNHGVASRGDGAPPPGGPAQAGLGRPRGPGGPGPAAPGRAAWQPAGHAGNPAGLAPPSDHPQVDSPGTAGPPRDQPGDPRPGAATGGGEPRLGIPPGARRADPSRPPHQPGDRAADPPRNGLPARSPRPGHLLAQLRARPGGGTAGV